jgi:signal peptidase II
MRAAHHGEWMALAASIFAGDQATKFIVRQLLPPESMHSIVPGFFDLVHTSNPGVAFSLFANARSPWVTGLLVAFSAAVMIFLAWMLIEGRAGGYFGRNGMALILGGAAGNVLDRVLRGRVTDFLDFYYRGYHWPAFNLADSAIVLGAALVFVELFRDWQSPAERIS